MIPKTKIQKEVALLSQDLPEIGKEIVAWAYENALSKMVVQSRGSLFCLECGHKWKPEIQLEAAILGVTCPVCGKKLKLVQGEGRSVFTEAAYVSLIDVRGRFQLERVILAKKQCKKLLRPVYCYHEVMQRWVSGEGEMVVMTIGVNGMSYCADSWAYGSHMEVRETYSTKAEIRHDIAPYRIYPKKKILPIIRRNGFKGSFHGIAPHDLFPSILRYSIAETLLKAGQASLLKHFLNEFKGDTKKSWAAIWPIIKICIRNNYKVRDASMWLDYLAMIDFFKKDLRNPFYVCPENLKEAHDRYLKKKKTHDKAEKLIKLKQQIEKDQQDFLRQKGKFLDLEFTNGRITVKPLRSVKEFLDEADTLKHCLFESGYYKRADSLIFSARINEKPIETIEVSLKSMLIQQSRGMNNNPSRYHKEIVSLVEDNLQQIRQLKNQKQAV